MRQRIPLLSIVLLAVFMAGSMLPAVEATPKKWIMACSLAEDHPSFIAFTNLAKELETTTGGAWTFEIYANATLGTEQECIDMVRSGTITMCFTNLTILEQFIPDFGLFALPYLFRSWDDFADYVTNSHNCAQLFAQLERDFNLGRSILQLNGSRCLSTYKIGTIQRPDDLKGVKVRSMEAQVWQDVITALGATPIPVNYSELYMALQTGVVNGQDNGIPILYSGKFYEVLDNIYRTDHCYNTGIYWIHPQSYAGLTENERVLLDSLKQKYLVKEYDERMIEYNRAGEEAITAKGVRIWEPEEFDINAFYTRADALVNEKYLNNPKFNKYIIDIRQRFNY